MSDIEHDLQRMLAARAGEVDPHLTGAGIRALAGRRRAQRLRTVGLPAAGTVLAAALLVTPFVLIHHGDSPQRPGPVIAPAASYHPTLVPTPTPTPTPTPSTPRLAWPTPATTRPPVASPSVHLSVAPGAALPSSEVTEVPEPSATTSRVPTAVPTSPVQSH